MAITSAKAIVALPATKTAQETKRHAQREAEEKVRVLQERRRLIEAELTKS
jgi:hypothetical protein